MAVHAHANGWRTDMASVSLPGGSSRIAAGLANLNNCKRPLPSQDDPATLFPDHVSSLDGSPPKRSAHGPKDMSTVNGSSFRSGNTVMAPIQNSTDPSATSLVGADGLASSMSGDGSGNSSTTEHVENGYHHNGMMKLEGIGADKYGPDFIVALYGCTGYGELALKANSGSSSQSVYVSSSSGGAGSGGSNLLTWDEDAETVLLAWAVVDTKLNKVIAVEERLIRPWRGSPDHILLGNFRLESGVAEDAIRTSNVTLEDALQQFKETIRTRTNGSFLLVTLGPELIRQQMIPECARHGIALPGYFFSFVDLLGNEREVSSATSKRLSELLENNRLVVTSTDVTAEYGKRHVMDMAKLIQFMVHSGHDFSVSQHIAQRYEPGLCKTDQVSDDCVVRARGLPWQASDLDVSRFFHGLDIPRGGIALCLSANGRRNGEAFVLFTDQQQRDLALQRHRHHMDKRYVEVYKALAEDFQQVAGVCTNEAEQFLLRKGDVIIRMRGLPYDATAEQVLEFFTAGDNPIGVVDGEAGVLFVRNREDRSTGDAFVLLSSEDDGQRAIAKHRQRIGSRYIELFRSTAAEVQQVLNKNHDRSINTQLPLIATPPLMAGLMSSGAGLMSVPSPLLASVQRNCVRLRGLPFGSGIEDILDFLGDFSKHIVVQGVHMVYNAQGQPSGEAFIQLDSDQAAFQIARDRHNQYINLTKYGKRNRYVEVYQCSADDMNGNGANQAVNMTSMRPLMTQGLAGVNPYTPNFNGFSSNAFPPGTDASTLARTTPRNPTWHAAVALLGLPDPAHVPTNTFSPSVIPGLMNGHMNSLNANVGNFCLVQIRNLPYSANANDIVKFLSGTGLMGPECVQLNRHTDGRPNNGEAFVIFASREEAERAVHDRNRRSLGNRTLELTVLG